jgi:hypothetical protein
MEVKKVEEEMGGTDCTKQVPTMPQSAQNIAEITCDFFLRFFAIFLGAV